MPFEEAREFVRSFKLKNQRDWRDFLKSKDKPQNLTAKPERVYKDKGWIGIRDWLGTTIGWDGEWEDFNIARNYIRQLGLKNQKEWLSFASSKDKPYNIPRSPEKVYKKTGWLGLGDWLGTYTKHEKEFMLYREAKRLIRSFNIKNQNDFREWVKSKDCPSNFPSAPEKQYKNEWLSLRDFIGTTEGWDGNWLSFFEAKKRVWELDLKSKLDWAKYIKSPNKLKKIPNSPRTVYKEEWKGWGDFLGTKTIAPQNKLFLTYEKASELVIKLKIKTHGEWTLFKKSSKFQKYNLPKAPEIVYKDKGWKGYPSFFGKIKVEKYSFEEAKEYISSKGIKTLKEWHDYSKTDRPEFIPSNPQRLYRDKGWKGWDDFLGKE
tara:strand:- start:220 stop:1344 length:1125 start_codon:yes stop_codon:yes gene_type:complete